MGEIVSFKHTDFTWKKKIHRECQVRKSPEIMNIVIPISVQHRIKQTDRQRELEDLRRAKYLYEVTRGNMDFITEMTEEEYANFENGWEEF